MGCNLCRTATVVPVSTATGEKYPVGYVRRTEQRADSTEEIPLRSTQLKSINQAASLQSDERAGHKSSVDVSASNDLLPVTVFDQTAPRSITTETILSSTQDTSNSSKNSSASNGRAVQSTSAGSKRVRARPKAARAFALESSPSGSGESVLPNDSPVEWHGTHFTYDDLVSSSASTNTERTLFRQDTISRFTSARVKSFHTNSNVEIDDLASDSDESYPLYRSFVSSSSSCSNVSQKFDLRSLKAHELKVNVDVDQDTIEHETEFHLAPSSHTSSERDKCTTDQKTMIRSESRNRTKSDIYPHTIVYETSYESDTDLQH